MRGFLRILAYSRFASPDSERLGGSLFRRLSELPMTSRYWLALFERTPRWLKALEISQRKHFTITSRERPMHFGGHIRWPRRAIAVGATRNLRGLRGEWLQLELASPLI